jgi:hypothetical protein
MKYFGLKRRRGVPLSAVDMQYGEPTMRYIGVGAKKLKALTKQLDAKLGPCGPVGGRSRLERARSRFALVESGQVEPSVAAALERDYQREFARFRAAAKRRVGGGASRTGNYGGHLPSPEATEGGRGRRDQKTEPPHVGAYEAKGGHRTGKSGEPAGWKTCPTRGMEPPDVDCYVGKTTAGTKGI